MVLLTTQRGDATLDPRLSQDYFPLRLNDNSWKEKQLGISIPEECRHRPFDSSCTSARRMTADLFRKIIKMVGEEAK